jgi:hypothetical protein
MSNPFDYLNSINVNKNNMMRGSENDELAEKQYNAFLVNRGLSYFQDTVALANEMNLRADLDNKPQYEFLLNIVRPRKRFSKWHKKDQDDKVDIIIQYYNCSQRKALEILNVLTEDQFSQIRETVLKGKEV